MRQRPTLLFLCGFVWVALGVAAEPAPDATASRLLGAALASDRGYEKLTWLSDRIGHRLSGAPSLDRAIEWAAASFREDGLERVWTEAVAVPHWVRGEASARLVSPVTLEVPVLALGGSVPTPPGGTRAEVVVVDGFEQLERIGEAARGKIVLYDRIMRSGWGPDGYGSLAELRVDGAAHAAKHGAVATLVRSLGTADFRLPHTGMLAYEDGVPEIPSAALAAEDAGLIRRLVEAGETVSVELRLGCRTLPDVPSANVLAEIPGREFPEQVVLIGAHLDSWDVGSGAHDDGAGVVTVMETMRLLRALGRAPRRTVRAVLFTNEENGLRGGKDYAARHLDEMPDHVAAIEMDSGGFAPRGFGVTAGEGAVETLRRHAELLAGIGADEIVDGGGGADISPMKAHGVPQIGLRVDGERYFDYHHTEADTLDKVDPADLRLDIAAMSVMTWLLAEAETTLPRHVPEAPEAPEAED